MQFVLQSFNFNLCRLQLSPRRLILLSFPAPILQTGHARLLIPQRPGADLMIAYVVLERHLAVILPRCIAFSEEELKNIWEDYGKGNLISGYILLMIYSGMMPGELMQAEKKMTHWDTQEIIGCGLKTKKRKETPIVIADIVVPVL